MIEKPYFGKPYNEVVMYYISRSLLAKVSWSVVHYYYMYEPFIMKVKSTKVLNMTFWASYAPQEKTLLFPYYFDNLKFTNFESFGFFWVFPR